MCAGHKMCMAPRSDCVACVREREGAHRIFVGNLKERDYFTGLLIDWSVMLERI